MTTNAPAQLLGYSIQFPRALYHLLKCGPGDSISIEVIADVATHKENNTYLVEEDKTSTISNPLTDRSKDLWKTFYNWILAIKDGKLKLETTHFLLYCNRSGKSAIVNKFDSTKSENEAQILISELKNSFTDLTKDHEIWQYYNYVINENSNILAKIIPLFELQIKDGLGFKEIEYELKRIHIPDSQLDFLSDQLNGWLQKDIMTKISSKKNAIVYWEEFNHQFTVLVQRVRQRELIDFTLKELPQSETIHRQVKARPDYIQQLELIQASDDEIQEAVSDFLRAKVNRYKWIEAEIIDEEVASDFEVKLHKYWENQQKRIEVTEKTLEECERGKLLFLDCRNRQETIRDMTPPSCTISGTYHSLSDGRQIGWHPQWKNK